MLYHKLAYGLFAMALLALSATGCVKNTEIKTFPTTDLAISDLKGGATEAVVGDYPVIAYQARESAGQLTMAGPPFDKVDAGIAVSKEAGPLKALITDALRRIIEDKTYNNVLISWALTTAKIDAPAAPAELPAIADVPQLADGELKVGMELSYAPMEFFNEFKQEAGVDVEIARALGTALGVEVVFVDMPFEALLGAVETGKVDIVISAITVTEEREQSVDFVKYLTLGSAILVPKANPAAIHRFKDLCGHVVGVQNGTSQLSALQTMSCE